MQLIISGKQKDYHQTIQNNEEGEFVNHIVVTGFMGSGKTRVGKRLAQDLGLPFVDIDKAIAKKMNMSIADLLDKFGDPYYRALETILIKELLQDNKRQVISVSSGLPVQKQNQEFLPKLGTIVYLKASFATIRKRLEGNENLAQNPEEWAEKMQKLLKQRDPVYAGMADITVVTGEKPFEDLIAEIEQKLAEKTVEKNDSVL